MNNVMASDKAVLEPRSGGRNLAVGEAMPQSGERNQRITALAVTGTQPWVKQAPWALRNPRLDATTNRTALAVAGISPVSRFESQSYSNVQSAIFSTVSRKFTYNMLNLLNKKQLKDFLL